MCKMCNSASKIENTKKYIVIHNVAASLSVIIIQMVFLRVYVSKDKV